MENRKLLALTVWTVVGSYVGFLMMCIATFTNSWILTRETIRTTNDTGTEEREITQHSGLLVTCRIEDRTHWIPHEGENSSWDTPLSESRCQKLKDVIRRAAAASTAATTDQENTAADITNTITHAVHIHTSKIFIVPLFTSFLLLSAVIVCTISQFMPKRRCMVFLTGTICVVCGLMSLTGIVRYIIAVNDAIIEKHSQTNDVEFEHTYKISFIFAVLAFLQANGVGVASLYLFILLEKQAARSEKERVRHHLQRLGMNVMCVPNTEVETSFSNPEQETERYGLPVSSWKETQYGFEGERDWKDGERSQSDL